ncbi:hypothetical protein BKA66DRAFT_476961 [Pyrenochaeta sp. MPI-SDFR-AT-0127]|nr:hypothetical protein BKA66DRAFT_476961 [Pyrenochaeta sp. MPI-SDFR-AT-0127]
MKWTRKIKRALQPANSSSFENVIDDVLGLIIEELCDEYTNSDLLNLCLVSRELYLFTIPYLYRSVKLNLARASHLQLLHRLVQPGSRLAGKIRVLGILGTGRDSAIRLSDLYVLFSRLTHLEQLDWEGSLNIPQFILESLHVRFPRARFTVDAFQTKLGIANNAPHLQYSVLNNPAGWQLTKFDFSPNYVSQLYGNLKYDLVSMLKRNRTLWFLRIYEDQTLYGYKLYPEVLRHFRGGTFPPLTQLLLSSNIFTSRELAIWGSRGGWDKLTVLKIHDPERLCEFIGRTPKLNDLMFYSTDPFDIDQVEAHLDFTSVEAPFGKLRRLWYKDVDNEDSAVQDRRVVPWCMLKRLPDITDLDIHRSRFDYAVPGSSLDTPTAEEIRQIRKLCPDIERFRFDVALHGQTAGWPTDVLDEIAQFKKPIELQLYLHFQDKFWTRATIHRVKCRKIFKLIVEKRRSLGLPCERPFQVGFKVVRLFEEIRECWNVPDYVFYLNDSGKHKLDRYMYWPPKESPESMSIEDLRMKRKKEFLSRKLKWDRHGYEREIRRRESCHNTTEGDAMGSTLYDSWT